MSELNGRGRYRQVLAEPYFKRLLAARTISNFGNGMAPTALAFAVFGLPGGNASQLSLVLAAQSIPLIFMLPIGGVIADRVGRARMIASMDIVLSFVVFGIAGLFALDEATIPRLVVLQAITGVLNALWYPAYPGLPADLVADPHLQSANSLISLGSNSATILGAAAGGWLVTTVGSPTAIALDALTFLVAGLLVATFRHMSERSESNESVLRDLHDGWKVFWSFKWVVVVVAAFSVIVMALQGSERVLGPLVARDFFEGAKTWAQVLSVESVGLLAGSLLGGRWHPRRPMVAGMLVTLPATVYLLMLAAPAPLPFILAAAFLWGVGMELMMIWWFTALQANVPKESIGRVASFDAFGSLVFGPIGLALAGPLADQYGSQPVLLAAGSLIAVVVFASLFNRDLRGLRAASAG